MTHGSSESLHQLEQLVANVEAMTTMFSLDNEQGEASDPTGAVTAVVGQDSRIRSLSVLPQWQKVVDSAGLAAAVQGAVGRAVCAVYGIEPAEEGANQPERDATEPDAERDATVPDADITAEHRARSQQMVDDQLSKLEQAPHRDKGEMIAELRGLADTAEGIAREWQAAADQDEEAAGVELFSRNRRVSMTFAPGGIMTGVDFDQNWLAGKSGNVVTENLTEILEQATELSPGLDVGAVMEQARQMSGR